MVDLRIYRASFVVSLLTLLVVMFSLQERPAPLSAPIAPDAFKGDVAFGDAARLTDRFPDHTPGSTGDQAIGSFAQQRLRALGFETTRDSFSGQFEGNDVSLSNVIGVLNAPSDRQVVVMAPRDAAGRPGASSASSTAVLLQLAQSMAGSSRRKTLVFVSVDGGTADNAGARRFAETYAARDKVDAVLMVDDIGAVHTRRPFVLPWSSKSRRGSLQVLRTAQAALSRESGVPLQQSSWVGQFIRQAWPVTLRGQGPLVANGFNAVTLTARGEVPRGDGPDTLAGLDRDRLQTFGRAAFATALAFDGTQFLKASPRRYIVAGHKVIPDWAISLFAVGLILPAVIAAFDAFARARRRALPVGGWIRWIGASVVPFAVVLLAAFALQLVGWFPESVSEALAPATRPSLVQALAALAFFLALFVLAWVFVRPRLAGRVSSLGLPGPAAAVAIALLLSVEVLAVCIVDPFAALLLVPAAHLSVLAALPERPRRSLIAAGIVVGALVLPILALVYYGQSFDLGADIVGYALMLVTSPLGSAWTALLGSLIAGTLTSAALVSFAHARVDKVDDPVTVRGPVTYAGPGSLGGTESALRR